MAEWLANPCALKIEVRYRGAQALAGNVAKPRGRERGWGRGLERLDDQWTSTRTLRLYLA